MIKSAYVHIPFCKSICSYCDFCKMLYHEKFIEEYLLALTKEIKTNYKNELLDTLYVGGGTPSSLSIKLLTKLLDILKNFNLSDNYEFTFECNISDINEDFLKVIKKYKINRLSIGIESFDEENLKFLNRKSTYDDAKEKISLCKKYGFNNINVDLIYALPSENINTLKSDLDKIISLDVTHISTYSLMIEPNTLLSIKNIKPINEKLDRKMYDVICKTLKNNGFNHYEISNFSKPNYESKHNLVYWHNEKYYGFGLGASGYIQDFRYNNTKNFKSYISGKFLSDKESITKKDNISYGLILGFRLIKGINVKDFFSKYDVDLLENEKILKLLKNKKLVLKNGYLSINKKYLYVENEILIEFI